MIKLAAEIGAPCSLVSLEGTYAHIKTVRTQFQPSIGYCHALLERLKREGNFPIKEYSCSQATLEQIFDNFAQEQEFAPFNRQTIAVQKKSLDFSEAPAKRMAEGAQTYTGQLNQSSYNGVNSSVAENSPLLVGDDADENK